VSVVGARLVDISQNGMLLEAPVPLVPDTHLRLRLVVGGVKAEVETRVAHSRRRNRTGSRPWGVGLEFAEVPAEVRDRLTRALGTWRAKPRTA
jgi:Tfp pilus assembly protein PilZ